MARGMLFRAGFTVLIVVIVLVHEACSGNDSYHHSCPPSSCGNIQNISYPFRLKGDPPICGDQRYNLSCENNQTVLYLYAGKYYVQEINYSTYTIRVVDPSIQKDNCSSIPRYFLNNDNFSSGDPYTLSYSDNISVRCDSGRHQQVGVEMLLYDVPMAVMGVVWMKCEKPMSNGVNSYKYLDWSNCLSNGVNSSNSSLFHSKSYRYVSSLCYTSLWDLGECQIVQMCPTASKGAYPTNCSDLYHQVAYGFQLSWVQVLCDNFTGDDFCYLDDGNFRVQCDRYYLPHPNGALSKLAITGITLGSLLLPLVIFALYRLYTYNKVEKEHRANINKFLEDYRNFKPTRYSYVDIKRITSQFSEKLGEGAYGTVFKGKLSHEIHVAVKILNTSKGNGEEFINEVRTMGTIHHVNVVRLVGFCADGFRRALVYEFLPNDSLEKFISSTATKNPILNLDKLQNISLGVAKGIEYLHQGCDQRILHFDIKPHNVLLDQNFNPKISDFGLAKLCAKDQSAVSMTTARGTMGYIAPEVFSRNFGNVSSKADVYSFGILLLEIVGGRKNVDVTVENGSQIYFPEWIYNVLEQKEDIRIFVEDDEDAKIAKKLATVGLWCIQWHPMDRPSIKDVVKMLEGDGDKLIMPPNPFASAGHVKNNANILTKRQNQELEVIPESE